MKERKKYILRCLSFLLALLLVVSCCGSKLLHSSLASSIS